MLRATMLVDATHAALKDAEKALDGVAVDAPVDLFAASFPIYIIILHIG